MHPRGRWVAGSVLAAAKSPDLGPVSALAHPAPAPVLGAGGIDEQPGALGSIALADLGDPSVGSQIKIHAVYGNGDNNYHSNQTLAGLPVGTIRLGGDGTGGFTGTLSGVNFNNFAGNQFFTIQVVPEPASSLLIAIGLATIVCRRGRRT